MDDLLRRLAPRPSDYGGLPGKITREDDAGNVYDETGRKIFNKFDQTEQPDSWLDTAISTATAPAKLATALVGSLNPYGQDGWQVPPIISEPAAAFARSGESTGFGDDGRFYLPNVQNPQVAQDTLTQLMTVYGGNALNPLARVPKGAVASGAVKQAADALPMDQASRLQRARDMGFDTSRTMYHGTNADFDAFRPSERGAYGPGVYVTPDADYANRYAIGRSGWEQDTRIMPLHVRGDLADGLLYESLKREARASGVPDESIGSVVQQQLAEMGYTGVEGKANQAVTIFDPSNIRSVNAAFDPARAGENGLLLSDNKPSLLGSALASGQGEARGITAYHGSPHDFDRFDLSKIGTGEGAQAYGHGLYFAESEDVARSYRDSLSAGGVGQLSRGWLRQNGGDVDRTLEYLRGRASHPANVASQTPFAINLRKAIDELEQAKAQGLETGHMYQVRINANPEDFLDWDVPLSKQSEKVRNALANIPVPQVDDHALAAVLAERMRDPYSTGQDFIHALSRIDEAGDPASPKVSAALREAGIPGIRYLDQMSRDAGGGSRNLVLNDDSLIEILKKYGWLAPGAMYGANDLDTQDQQQPY